MVKLRRGFTLTEVIVAMTLLTVSALGVAATALVALRSFTMAEVQERTLREAQDILDSLAALPASHAGSRNIGTARITWPASDSSGAIRIMVSWPDHSSSTLVGQR